MKYINQILSLITILAFTACQPFVEEKSELGPVPTPTFTISQGDTPNEFILENTTEGAFLTQWDLGDLGTREGDMVTVTYPFRGDYEVSMTTFARGGHASGTQSLTVTQDDPNACFGNFELLTGCSEKVWKLAPEPNAMHIGPSIEETWWGNSEGDVTERTCHFDDEYIFRANGEFEYDNKGDFWADSDGNGGVFPAELGLTVGCHPGSDWPEAFKAWDSGVHTFNITPSSLTVVGEGAWIGLYKIGTTDEAYVPQSSVSLSILEISAERMTLFADYGWGVWRITLVAQ